MTKVYAGTAVAVVVALLAGTAWFALTGGDAHADCRAGVAGGDIGGPFTLLDKTGAEVTDKDVITGPALIYFGYTFCPDVCPVDNVRNADAVDILEERGLDVTPVFISVDPARDTPEVIGDYAEAIHPRMVGLTGSPEQVKAASVAYKTYFSIPDPSDPNYLVDHSTFTYLVTPQDGFLDFFKREETPDEMADRVACFLDGA